MFYLFSFSNLTFSSIFCFGLFEFFFTQSHTSLGRKSDRFVLNCKLMCLFKINCKHLGKVMRFGFLPVFSSSF